MASVYRSTLLVLIDRHVQQSLSVGLVPCNLWCGNQIHWQHIDMAQLGEGLLPESQRHSRHEQGFKALTYQRRALGNLMLQSTAHGRVAEVARQACPATCSVQQGSGRSERSGLVVRVS